MDLNPTQSSSPERGTSGLVAELLETAGQLVTAEAQRAQASVHRSLGLTADRIGLALGLLCLTLLGGGAAMTSAILALGAALNGRYWLSALLVSVVLFLLAVPLKMILLKRNRST